MADNNGFTVANIYFNDRNECEVEMIVQTSYPSLAAGDFVTIMGITGCQVQDYEKVLGAKRHPQIHRQGDCLVGRAERLLTGCLPFRAQGVVPQDVCGRVAYSR